MPAPDEIDELELLAEPVVVNDPASTAPAQTTGWRVLAVLSALMGFASISTDFYLPTMPVMAETLGANSGAVELTISGYLMGFSLGQLFWGPLSDRHGRRLPVAAGLMLFIIGSAGCALAGNIESIIGWRVVQALGAAAGVVVSRAIVRDRYHGPRAAQMLSTLMVVMAIAPLIGPLAGAQVEALAGWRAIFWLLVIVGLVSLAALFTIPETLPVERRGRLPLGRAFVRYAKLLTHRRIIAYASAGGFFYAGMFAYIAGTPFAYITYYQLPSGLYGLLFGAGILGIMATNMLNARLVARLGSDRLLISGTTAAAVSGCILALAAFTGWGGLWGLFIPLLAFVSCTGLIVANSIAGALADYPSEAGAVSALVGSLQYGSGILGSGLVGIYADGTPWTMGWVIASTSVASFLCAVMLAKRTQVASPE